MLLLFGVCLELTTQERPPINIFTPKDYDGASQNWSISQSENKYIYVANNKGLLEYNGAKWNLYPSPNQTNLRSVKVIDSLIYTGNYHDFGYWEKDSFGVLNYTSLSQELGADLLEDEEFWNIMELDNSILFQSLDRIHIYNKSTKAYNIIDSGLKISSLFKVGSNFYFQNLNSSLYKIDRGEAVLVCKDTLLNDNVIVNIYNHDNTLLILTQDNGFYELQDGRLIPWIIPANSVLSTISVFSSIQLKDKSFVLGTISDGLICISSSGNITFQIAQSSGLSNNTVLSIYEDLDSNIWLGLDNGVNCINMKSPYTIYVDNSGTIGSVYTSVIHNDMLYLGSNQGLFVKPLKSNDDFEFVEGTQGQVWFLDVIDNTLFCGHNSGTFVINQRNAKKIVNIQGTWLVKPVLGQNNLLIQGNYNGLYILHKPNTEWVLRNKIKGFDISSRYFEFLNTEEILLNHEYKGIYKLKINNALTNVVSFSKDTLVDKGINSSLVKYNNKLLYTIKGGIYKYNINSNTFKIDTLLSELIDKNNYSSGKLVFDKTTNKLWGFSPSGINYVTSSKLSGEQKINNIPLSEDIRKDVLGYESITPIDNQRFLLGSTSGYLILDLNKIKNQDHNISINKIGISKLKENDTLKQVDLKKAGEFENSEGNIQFSYSVSEFSRTQQPKYQYKLDGIYNHWSDWSTDSNVFFKNLAFGNYTFYVRGKVGNQVTLNTASYTFTIKRPWLLSNIAIAAYVIALLLFAFSLHNIYKSYYRKQREHILQKTKREFELNELENKQQLMRFRNDKLREDIENKNRELGISTMNLIKKNEVLSTIKKELVKVKAEGKNLNSGIKIIDKNLNNNDDWNLFQEAFNNADKDFLKKVKSLHSTLTANDLRLCAYLRLNLSSKEIAPLLNISPRSVEVKRYRLRKKMGLSHETSLTDYILEI